MTNVCAKILIKGQLAQKLERKQTEGQTDRTDCSTLPANTAGNKDMLRLLRW